MVVNVQIGNGNSQQSTLCIKNVSSSDTFSARSELFRFILLYLTVFEKDKMKNLKKKTQVQEKVYTKVERGLVTFEPKPN